MKKLAALSALGNKDFVKSGSRVAGRIGLATKHYSPQILLGVGVVGITTATVLACKATLELDNVLAHGKLVRTRINEKTTSLTAEEYSSTDHKRELTVAYMVTVKELTKLYALPLSIGVVSVGCIIGGQGIVHKRNVAAIAAYKGLEESFAKYRSRVVEEFGEEKDRNIHQGITHEMREGEDGKKHKTAVVDTNSTSNHVRIFDASNKHWATSPDYNLHFLTVQETMANERLQRVGHVFLNDILRELGFEDTKAGAVTGWVLNGDGDNHIDFGINDLQSQGARTFGTDEEVDCVMLDFNFDGVILDFLSEN